MASKYYSNPHHSGNISTKFIKDKNGRMRIQPKDLNIVWGRDNRYWKVPQNMDGAAELYQVSWLEMSGAVEEMRAKKKYEVGFRVSLNPDAFGWGKHPVYIMVKKGKEGRSAATKIMMNPNEKGEFEIKGRSSSEESLGGDGKLYFGLYEVWSGKWKGGLKIHHAFIKELS